VIRPQPVFPNPAPQNPRRSGVRIENASRTSAFLSCIGLESTPPLQQISDNLLNSR